MADCRASSDDFVATQCYSVKTGKVSTILVREKKRKVSESKTDSTRRKTDRLIPTCLPTRPSPKADVVVGIVTKPQTNQESKAANKVNLWSVSSENLRCRSSVGNPKEHVRIRSKFGGSTDNVGRKRSGGRKRHSLNAELIREGKYAHFSAFSSSDSEYSSAEEELSAVSMTLTSMPTSVGRKSRKARGEKRTSSLRSTAKVRPFDKEVRLGCHQFWLR